MLQLFTIHSITNLPLPYTAGVLQVPKHCLRQRRRNPILELSSPSSLGRPVQRTPGGGELIMTRATIVGR